MTNYRGKSCSGHPRSVCEFVKRICVVAELTEHFLEERAQGGWYLSPGSHPALPMSHKST